MTPILNANAKGGDRTMDFVLKRGPRFTMQDGPLRGRTYRKGQVYTEIPNEMADRFEAVNDPAPTTAPVEAEPKQDFTATEQTWTGFDDNPGNEED